MALYCTPEYQTSDLKDRSIFYPRAVIRTVIGKKVSGKKVSEKKYHF